MSEVHEVVLTTPLGLDADRDADVRYGLERLGFTAVDEHSGRVWLLDGKLHYFAGHHPSHGEHGKWGVDGLRELVLALPWDRRAPGVDLQVLWWSDLTTVADDGWGGRSAPYAWTHETWEVR